MSATGYLLQATLICLWWLGLALSPSLFAAFQFEGISPRAVWSFLVPDVALIAVLSAVRCYCRSAQIEFVILGAFAYAALYCCNALIITGTGGLPTGLMLMGVAYNLFLCFNVSLFRESKSQRFCSNVVKTLVQVACIWTVSLFVIPLILIESFGAPPMPREGYAPVIAGAGFLAFSTLGLTSAFFMVRDGSGTPLPMDQTNTLVVSGPYQFVRNPMAIAGIGQGLSIALFFQSIPIAVYSMLGMVVWHYVVRPFEEQNMLLRFGERYQQYRARVYCWIPTFERSPQN